MTRQYKTNTAYIHHKWMSIKRLWVMQPRSLKPALMVLTVLVFTFMLNSIFLVGRGSQQLSDELLLETDISSSSSSSSSNWLQPQVHPKPPSVHYQVSSTQNIEQIKKETPTNNRKIPVEKVNEEKKNQRSSNNVKTEYSPTDDFFNPMKGKVVHKKNKNNENTIKALHHHEPKTDASKIRDDSSLENQNLINSQKAKKEKSVGDNKHGKESEEVSFGFVNPNFKPPDMSQASLVDLKGFIDNSSRTNIGMNAGSVIGSVIGAVVSAKKFMASEDQQSKVKFESPTNRDEKSQVVDINGGSKQISNSNSNNMQENQTNVQANSKKVHSKESRVIQNGFGSLISQVGPLMSAAMGKNPQDSGNPIASLMGGLGPVLLSGAFGGSSSQSGNDNPMASIMKMGTALLSNGMSQNSGNKKTGSQSSSDKDEYHLLKSIATGFGQQLMNGVLGKQTSPGKENSKVSQSQQAVNPVNSLLNGIGPALLGGAVQNMLGGSKKDSSNGNGSQGNKNASPIESMISGLGPMLLAGALGQGFGGGNNGQAEGRSNSKRLESGQDVSPLQSLMSGLGPAVMNAVGQGFGNGFSNSGSKDGSSALGGIFSGMAPAILGHVVGRSIGSKYKSIKDDNALSPVSTHSEDKDKIDITNSKVNSLTGDGTFHDVIQASSPMDKAMLTSVVKSVVAMVLPERILVPEVNSTRGFWHMAFNLALGNPRDEKGRHSQFWKWLREYGSDSWTTRPREHEKPPLWITRALSNPDRLKYTGEIRQFYEIIKNPQPICQHIHSIGGTYNWKEDVMEDERAVCVDSDVAPKKEDDCIVYSFGLKSQWMFEEAMQKKGCEVYVFDPAESSGNHNHSRNIHFYSVGISDVNVTKESNGMKHQLFTLSAILGHLGHERTYLAYLRMDLGGDEWMVLDQIIEDTPQALSNVKQLNVVVNLEKVLKDPSNYKKFLDVLSNLESLGFQLFFSQPQKGKGNFFFLDPIHGDQVAMAYQMVFLRI